uniref:Uncharacterized protein n=1 Tax=viral metagenome TaxID=1070528 RepID=A0A6C0F1Z9_9ZZZZ
MDIIKLIMAEERILMCLTKLEGHLGWDTSAMCITSRILNLSHYICPEPIEHRAIYALLENRCSDSDLKPCQQCVYHMLPFFGFADDELNEYVKVLLGDNCEYQMPGHCMFTEEFYEEIYELMVQEHLESWRDGYFEPEDLTPDELVMHNEYIAYAKEHKLM